MRKKLLPNTWGLFVLVSLAGPAFGQSADTGNAAPSQKTSVAGVSSASDESGDLADIVITAQKRTETVNTIPIAVTALEMSDLKAAGVDTMRDLVSAVPDLQIHTAATAGYIGLALRGIATQSYSNAGNPSISTYIDGVYVDLAVGFSAELYDLQRIEVLRGPQGTLYGRSATGGNVNIVTADPTHEFSASADASYGNYNDVQTRGTLNLPVSDTLALRGDFATHNSDGFYGTEGTTTRNYGALDETDGRLIALWTPSDHFKWRLSLEHYLDEGTPGARLIASGANEKPLDGLSPYNQPSVPDPQPENYLENDAIRTRMDWEIAGPLTLSYIAGFQDIRAHYFYTTVEPAGGTTYSAFREYASYTSKAYFQEADLNYTTRVLKNVFGASYFDESIPTDGAHAIRAGVNQLFQTYPNNGIDKRSSGVFDQATYSLTDALNLTGGVRYNHDYQSQAAYHQTVCAATQYPNLTLAQISSVTGCSSPSYPFGGASFSNTSWKAGIDYTLTSATLLYASATTSYKPGGVQPTVPAPLPTSYASEHVISYETGLKMQLLNRQLDLRLAGFYVNYTNLQDFQNVTLPTRQVLLTLNAAKARNYGVEFETDWNMTPADHFKGFATYLNATYTKYNGAINILNNAIIGSLAGSHLPFAPDETVRGQYSHDFILPNGGKILPMAAVYWQSKSYTQSYNIPVFGINPYSKTDLSLTYYDPTDHWNLGAYVDNLENNAIRTGDFASQNIVYSEYGAPRTYGLGVSVKY